MSLILLIYLLESLDSINGIFMILGVFIFVALILALLIRANTSDNQTEVVWKLNSYIKKLMVWFFIVLLVNAPIPTKKTAYMMAGVYLTEELAETDLAQKVYGNSGEIADKLVKLVNKQLDNYLSEEVKEVNK